MNVFFRSCSEICKSRLAYIFLLANLFVCSFAMDWNKVFSYIDEHNEKHGQAVSALKSSGTVSFSDCSYYRQISPDEILKSVFTLISFPAQIGTEIFIEDLKKQYSDWCIETFEVLEIFVLVIFNSMYLFLLGVFIEQLYEKFCTKPLTKEKYLNL